MGHPVVEVGERPGAEALLPAEFFRGLKAAATPKGGGGVHDIPFMPR